MSKTGLITKLKVTFNELSGTADAKASEMGTDIYDEVVGGNAGDISAHGSNTAPVGTLECDGSAISRTTYADLFAIIGENFGEGDGSSTFNIPDLRGQFLRGYDNGAGTDPDAGDRTAMATGGVIGDNVGSIQYFATQGHRHLSPAQSWQIGDGEFKQSLYVQNDGGTNRRVGRTATSYNAFRYQTDDPRTDGVHGTPEIKSESRSKNASVMFVIKY